MGKSFRQVYLSLKLFPQKAVPYLFKLSLVFINSKSRVSSFLVLTYMAKTWFKHHLVAIIYVYHRKLLKFKCTDTLFVFQISRSWPLSTGVTVMVGGLLLGWRLRRLKFLGRRWLGQAWARGWRGCWAGRRHPIKPQ